MKKKTMTLFALIIAVFCMGFAIPFGGSACAMELDNDECDSIKVEK